MPSNFFATLRSYSFEKKLFLAIIAAAIAVRLFTLFVLPDAPLTDTLYHLTITRYVVQNHALPFHGIAGAAVFDLPVPLYYIITAIPFILLPIPFNLATAKAFPLIFSFLQLLVSFLLLRRMFPQHWFYGFAFVAMHPLLVIFGAVNYLETFASFFVLLSFFVYWRFVETGSRAFLAAMPFALAAMALSKESATVLVPVFFLAFLYQLWEKRPKPVTRAFTARAAFFVAASVLLCSAWFLISLQATGELSSSITGGIDRMISAKQTPFSFESLSLFPLSFNAAFWFFLDLSFGQIGIQPALAFTAFSLVAFPVFMLLLYGFAAGLRKKPKAVLPILACFLISSFLMVARGGDRFFHGRIMIPLMPLLAVPFCLAFMELTNVNWRKALALLFFILSFYSLAFASIYALHFNNTYNQHMPLYNFIRELPERSKVVIHSNKLRQVRFIAEKQVEHYSSFYGLDAQQMYAALKEQNVTHLADTCYAPTWEKGTIEQWLQQGVIAVAYSDSCSTLYELKR